MTEAPDPLIRVADLAKLRGCSRSNIYDAARRHPHLLPLDPSRTGIRSSAAYAWLRLCAERDAELVARQLRRHDALEAKRAAKRAAKQSARDTNVENLRKRMAAAIERLRQQYVAELAKAGGK